MYAATTTMGTQGEKPGMESRYEGKSSAKKSIAVWVCRAVKNTKSKSLSLYSRRMQLVNATMFYGTLTRCLGIHLSNFELAVTTWFIRHFLFKSVSMSYTFIYLCTFIKKYNLTMCSACCCSNKNHFTVFLLKNNDCVHGYAVGTFMSSLHLHKFH